MKMNGWAGRAVEALQRGRQRAAERELKLVETLSLGGRRQVSLVLCGGQRFLVGCGADSVTSIVAVPEGQEPVSASNANWGGGF